MVWRDPAEESNNLYPKLAVNDNRVSGSILVGGTRLPLWSFVGYASKDGFAAADNSYSVVDAGLTADELSEFLSFLFQVRGEFARLLLVLADVERIELERDLPAYGEGMTAWWDQSDLRFRVRDQLRRCIDVL